MGLRKKFKRIRRKVKKEIKRTPKNVSKAGKKVRKEIVRIPVNLSKTGTRIKKEVNRTPKNIGKGREKVRNELNRFEDRTGIPLRAVLEFIFKPAGLTKYATALESYVKSGSRRFSISPATHNLIREYKVVSRFRYGRGHKKLFFYYNANVPSGDGITFENRIYLRVRPNENTCAGRRLIFHEIVHTHQYYKHGTNVFIAKYLRDYFINLLRGKSPNRSYYKIGFEQEAYRLDRQFCEWLRNEKGFCVGERCN